MFAYATLHCTINSRCWSSFLKTITFCYFHICFSKSTAYNTFQFEKLFWIWWKVLDTIILWQDVGTCCEQTHAAFEVGLSLDQGQGVYSGWSDVVVSSQLRLCHTCIIDVMALLILVGRRSVSRSHMCCDLVTWQSIKEWHRLGLCSSLAFWVVETVDGAITS